MHAVAPEIVNVTEALTRFAFPGTSVQTSDHIRRLHWYVANRLVIEGGFHPDKILPRPPFRVESRGSRRYLHHDPLAGKSGERTLLGGLKTKQIDVAVSLPGIGPVIAISLKGTHNAFRNLTNRMEEAAGDCTNLHMSYPAMVYGFWHVLRANEEADSSPIAHFLLDGDDRYKPADVAVLASGQLSEGVERYAQALVRLSDREDLRDAPSRYEACGLTLVRTRGGESKCGVYPEFPAAGSVLDFNRMFDRLMSIYDERFVYSAPALKARTSRLEWEPDSPFIVDTIRDSAQFQEMKPRLR